MWFCSLTKGITPKFCRLCVCVIISKRSFELCICMDLYHLCTVERSPRQLHWRTQDHDWPPWSSGGFRHSKKTDNQRRWSELCFCWSDIVQPGHFSQSATNNSVSSKGKCAYLLTHLLTHSLTHSLNFLLTYIFIDWLTFRLVLL